MDFFQMFISGRLSTKQKRILMPGILVLLLALAACGPATDQSPEGSVAGQTAQPTAVPLATVEEAQVNPANEGYPPPPPVIMPVEESYPAETLPPPSATPFPDVYPPPTEAVVYVEPRIRLDLPVSSSDSVVTGTAPAGLALAVVDVTYNGALLGAGSTSNDGQFSINVDGLIEGNRLGLTFDELEPGMSLADMSIKYYPHRGEGFMNLPNVGVILDSTLIEP
jgi:hypothetical protein